MNDVTTIEAIEDWSDTAGNIIEHTPVPKGAAVLALTGDLGTGKTTFVQSIARVLGVTEPVTSPTFTIMKQYPTAHQLYQTLVHIDAYRIQSVDELAVLRFDLMLEEPNTLVCIEWADVIKSALPDHAHWYHLEINSEGKHTIQKQ